jgi:methyl-accepting chemotaxis protein
MKLRLGWGPKIALQFAVLLLPLAALLFLQAWMDLRRSAQMASAFPLHLQANAARKSYKQFVDGVGDAVDSGKLASAATQALRNAGTNLHQIAAAADGRGAAGMDADLTGLIEGLGESADLKSLMRERPTITRINDDLKRLDEEYESRIRTVVADAQSGARTQILAVWIAGTMSLALAVCFVRTMIARLTEPLKEGIRIARAIAVGDLSAARKVEGDDETAQLLNALCSMTGSLRQIVGKVRRSSDRIHAASADVANGNRDLSERTEKAAGNIQRTASSVEQITSAVRHSAGNANRANQLAAVASDTARKGGEAIGEVVTTMGQIESSSRQISEIIGVIDSIAFQTNILALNAAVEAARAGVQGRGFAVVAEEVRALARRSAGAAREIRALIHASVDKVKSGSRLVVDAGETMREIVQQVGRVSELIAEIDAAAVSQATEIGQLHEAVAGLDQMTRQNVSLVEQSFAASESMTFRLDTAARQESALPAYGNEAATVQPDAAGQPA